MSGKGICISTKWKHGNLIVKAAHWVIKDTVWGKSEHWTPSGKHGIINSNNVKQSKDNSSCASKMKFPIPSTLGSNSERKAKSG